MSAATKRDKLERDFEAAYARVEHLAQEGVTRVGLMTDEIKREAEQTGADVERSLSKAGKKG
jgi:hypothetical protein